jgi:uncharacterized protein
LVNVDISRIRGTLGETQQFSVTADAQEIGGDDVWVVGEVAISGQITNIGNSFRLEGTLTGKAFLECSRCLKAYEQAVHFQFEEEFSKEDILLQIEWIDIAPFIREALIFHEPMKPLCSENCRGICPACGADLNQTDCNCDRTVIDPRLAGLRRLLEP